MAEGFNKVDELRKGTILVKKVMDQLNRKYQVLKKDSVAVATLLKQKIHSESTKIRWYVNSCTKVRQNNLFKNNQSQLYKELGGRAKLGLAPNGEEATKFWSGIWSVQKRHDEDTTWLGEVRHRMSSIGKQEEVKIDIKDLEHGIRKMTNWKAPSQRFRSLHGVITESLQDCLDNGRVPD